MRSSWPSVRPGTGARAGRWSEVSESTGCPGAAAARRLAAAALAAGEPTSWFEPLYAAAGRGEVSVPWAARAPNPHLLDWLDGSPVEVSGRKVLVVGCGLGDDAEAVAARGGIVTAFDIAPSAHRRRAEALSRQPGLLRGR